MTKVETHRRIYLNHLSLFQCRPRILIIFVIVIHIHCRHIFCPVQHICQGPEQSHALHIEALIKGILR